MRKSQLFTALTVSLLFTACDIVEEPIPPGSAGGNGPDTSGTVTRRVLLEDYTGHRCNNCPGAAAVAQSLHDIYQDELILVGVHAGSFSPPYPPIGDGEYDTDFRTPAGNAYALQFDVAFQPAGLISRKEFGNFIVQSETAWSSNVADIIGEPADMDVQFTDFSYDATTNTVETTIKTIVLNPVTGDHFLTVFLTEDHVVDWQLDSDSSPPDIPDYDHRHVLRDNLNGTWGEAVISGSALAGDTITSTFTYQLSSNVLDPNNCALVAFVSRTDNYEVMQVAEQKFVE
ncbi:MAG: Omp28 family outer membrane lipoprotein [Flavobacteriales bacterium]|nr:Omp28 family outer membrane lipoprotein [Flavobacteriales bacterium]